MRKYLLSAVAASAVIAGSTTAMADEASATKWIDQEFQPSTLSKDEQMAEMKGSVYETCAQAVKCLKTIESERHV